MKLYTFYSSVYAPPTTRGLTNQVVLYIKRAEDDTITWLPKMVKLQTLLTTREIAYTKLSPFLMVLDICK